MAIPNLAMRMCQQYSLMRFGNWRKTKYTYMEMSFGVWYFVSWLLLATNHWWSRLPFQPTSRGVYNYGVLLAVECRFRNVRYWWSKAKIMMLLGHSWLVKSGSSILEKGGPTYLLNILIRGRRVPCRGAPERVWIKCILSLRVWKGRGALEIFWFFVLEYNAFWPTWAFQIVKHDIFTKCIHIKTLLPWTRTMPVSLVNMKNVLCFIFFLIHPLYEIHLQLLILFIQSKFTLV